MNTATILFLFVGGLAWGQYSPVPSSSYPALDANINSKLAHREQAGVPSGNCVVGKDVATNTTNGDMYWCSATNTWTLKGATGPAGPTGPPGGGGSGASSSSQLSDFAPTVAGGVLTIQPGKMRFGNTPCPGFGSVATATIGSMSGGATSGTAKLYISMTCALVLEWPAALGTVTWTLTGISAMGTATPGVPSTAFYVADVNISGSAVSSVTDQRAIPSLYAGVAGTGIVIDCSLGPCLTSVDTATVLTSGGPNVLLGTQDATGATTTKPNRTVTPDPSGTCPNSNEVVLSTASGNSFSCLAGTWHAMAGTGGSGTTPTGTGFVHVTGGAQDGAAVPLNEYKTGPQANFNVTTGGCANGADCMVVTSTNLPALGAGQCWIFEGYIATNANQPMTWKVWFGSGMTVANTYTPGASGDSLKVGDFAASYIVHANGQICNDVGSTTAQQAGSFASNVSNTSGASTSYGYFGPMTRTTTATNLQIGITVNVATGGDAVTVRSFRVWRDQ